MITISENNIVFVNMDTVEDVFIWDGQLTGCLDGAINDIKVGDIAIALRGGKAVAAGRITKLNSWKACGHAHAYKIWVRMNLFREQLPVALSAKQKDVLKATAQHYKCAYPGFQDALAIPSIDTACFMKLVYSLRGDLCTASSQKKDDQDAQLLHIIGRGDIADDMKIRLCNALCARGELADLVYDRDEHRSDTDHDLQWVATRIVPWEACTDFERTDPNNYILLDEQLADQFAMGMISFRNTGRQIQDSAMDEDAFDPWVDNDFNLPTLNKYQKKYMAYHRASVFKQWRSGLTKPMYVQGE